MNCKRQRSRYLDKTSQESGRFIILEGESPSLGVLVQPKKPNLGRHCEVLSEGDAESRETRRRMSRPKCESVNHIAAG